MCKQALTYISPSRSLRAIYVSEPGLYDIDGVPFEADESHVGKYYTKSESGNHWNILAHSPESFRQTWTLA